MMKPKTVSATNTRPKAHELRSITKELPPAKTRERSQAYRGVNKLPEIGKQTGSLNKSMNEKTPRSRQMDYIDRSYMYTEGPAALTEVSVMDPGLNRKYQSNSPFNASFEGREIENLALKKAYAEVLKEQMLARTAKKLIDKRNEMEFENKIVNENIFFNKFGNNNRFFGKHNLSAIQADGYEPPITGRSYIEIEPDDSYTAHRGPTHVIKSIQAFNINKKSNNNLINKSFDGYPRHHAHEVEPEFDEISEEIPNGYVSNIMTKKLASMMRGQGRGNIRKEKSNPIADEVSNFMKEVEHKKALERQIEERRMQKVQKQNENAFAMLEGQIEQLKESQNVLTQTIRSVAKAKDAIQAEVDNGETYADDFEEIEEDIVNDESVMGLEKSRKPSAGDLKSLKKEVQSSHTPRIAQKQIKGKKVNPVNHHQLPQSAPQAINRNLIGPNYHKLQSEIVKMKDEVQGNQKKIEKQLNDFKDLFRRWNSTITRQTKAVQPTQATQVQQPHQTQQAQNLYHAQTVQHVQPALPSHHQQAYYIQHAQREQHTQPYQDIPQQQYQQYREATPPKSPRSTKSSEGFKPAYRSVSTNRPRPVAASRVPVKAERKKFLPLQAPVQERPETEPEVLQLIFEEVMRLKEENEALKRNQTPVRRMQPQKEFREFREPVREIREPIREYREPVKEYREPVRELREPAKNFTPLSNYDLKQYEKRRIRSIGIQFHKRGVKHARNYNLTELL